MDNIIKTLRTIFRISNAAFEFQNSIQLAILGHIVPNKMQQLHKLALVEIEKENPDLSLIDKLLAEMKSTAEKREQSPKFPEGGVKIAANSQINDNNALTYQITRNGI